MNAFKKHPLWWWDFWSPCFIVLLAGSWIKNVDYYRLDGSTAAPLRKKWTDQFNDPANFRYRLSSVFLYKLYGNKMSAWCWQNHLIVLLHIFILAADCFSSQREPVHLASTSLLPTGSSSLMPHGIPRMTYRAYTECTASVSSSKSLCTASWLR